jgi:hypothetical protein
MYSRCLVCIAREKKDLKPCQALKGIVVICSQMGLQFSWQAAGPSVILKVANQSHGILASLRLSPVRPETTPLMALVDRHLSS